MVLNSVFVMPILDLLIAGGAAFSLWILCVDWRRNVETKSLLGSSLIVAGLLVIAIFYIADLVIMLVLPALAPEVDWPAAMEALHLDYLWLAVLAGTGSIIAGFVLVKRGLFTLVDDLRRTEREVTKHLDAHRKTGEALHVSVQRFAEIVNIASNAIISLDQDQRIHLFSRGAEDIFGYKAEEVIGRPLEMLLPARVRDVHHNHMDDFARSPEVSRLMNQRGKVAGLRKNGTEFPAEASISKIEMDGDTLFTVILHDISLREQQEAQLRHAQRMQVVGQLTGGVAHDFNNLLAVILGNLELAEERLEGNPKLRDLITRAIAATDRGATLTARLLAFSRKQTLQPKLIFVNRLVAGMTELLRRTLGATIEIETVEAGGTWKCKVDPGQLESALLNLAVNARDAMPGGGKLTIETANAWLDDDYAAAQGDIEPGQYVMISVTDTGTGMSPEVAGRAFEPFFTTKEVGQGTGLGLSMVYGFIKQSVGHVKIDSEVGHGTTVKIYLPRRREDETDVVPDPGDKPEHRGRLATILVVEDDAAVRELAVTMLKGLGYLPVEAADAGSALKLLDETPDVALLFTDVVLPGGMNGAELARVAQRRRPDLKVLYTSGYTDNPIADHDVPDNVAPMIEKPFRRAVLARKVQDVLDHDKDPSE